MDINKLRQMPRSEIAFLNVSTYLVLYSATKLKRVDVLQLDSVYSIRLFYESSRNGKEYVHSHSFYRLGEAVEAQKFVDLLCQHNEDIELTGATIRTDI